MEKVKVFNPHKHRVCINLSNYNGKEIPVNGEGFALLTEDELSYVLSSSKAFEKGVLKLADKQTTTLDIEIPVSANALTDQDILDLIKKPKAQIDLILAKIDNQKVLQRIIEMSKEQGKSIKLIDSFQKRLDEILL